MEWELETFPHCFQSKKQKLKTYAKFPQSDVTDVKRTRVSSFSLMHFKERIIVFSLVFDIYIEAKGVIIKNISD